MKFADLLKEAEAATAFLAKCVEALQAAEAALAKATEAQAGAAAGAAAAHVAIRLRLAERGHHCTTDPDGGVKVYQINDSAPEGWSAYHPIQGSDA